jgi:hypothetical protein
MKVSPGGFASNHSGRCDLTFHAELSEIFKMAVVEKC